MAIVDPSTLLENLCRENECEWLEFKKNQFNPEEVGQNVSALANSAILADKPHAYLVYGVKDETREIVGTTISLKKEKKGNEPFENWLVRWLDPVLQVDFIEFTYHDKHISMLRIDPAYQKPVSFMNERYIRIGSSTRPLRDYSEIEKSLWVTTSRFTFEQAIAAQHWKAEKIFAEFDCQKFFSLQGAENLTPDGVINRLQTSSLIIDDKQGGFDITNLFALVAARDLSRFPTVKDKAPRFVQYRGDSKLEGSRDHTGRLGYALAFQKMLAYVMDKVPQREEMQHGLRVKKYAYPEIAVREFVANALIHQDFSISGYPRIELFSNKLEITSPGRPLIPVDRFIDWTPRSRNTRLAALMRSLHLCEERGSGVDRAIAAIEEQELPPPWITADDSTKITLHAEISFASMTKEQRILACYQHACLRAESNDPMRNSSLRKRFGLPENRYAQVSQVIADAITAGLIRPLDAEQPNRNARYVPNDSGVM